MYINSNNEKIEPKTLETTHIINALAKAYREIFNSTSMKEFEKYSNNIMVLRAELDKRINNFADNIEVE